MIIPPILRTHIRSDTLTRAVAGGMVWRAWCGIVNPPSSISQFHIEQVWAGKIEAWPESVIHLCQECVRRARGK